jgi:glycyl-tRNA synthetase beta chain
MEAGWAWSAIQDGFGEALDYAISLYPDERGLDADKAVQLAEDIFSARYRALIEDVRHDVLEAALGDADASLLMSPRAVNFRVAAMKIAAEKADLVQTATRPINLVASAEKKEIEIQAWTNQMVSDLDSPEAVALVEVLPECSTQVAAAMLNEDAASAMTAIGALRGKINAFFESTMVMVDDLKVRDARLSMLKKVGDLLSMVGDWTKLTPDA